MEELKPERQLWRNTDPRVDINKRANIVILRSSTDIGTAHVDTKEVCCIWTSFKDYKFFNEKDKWNNIWQWTWAPLLKYDWCPWNNQDPRIIINSDADIIIWQPYDRVSIATVDTEKLWCIKTMIENHEVIDANDK